MEHTYKARFDKLLIRPLQLEDLEYLRNWRNDAEISKYFRKMNHITPAQQLEWYYDYLLLDGVYYWTICEGVKTIGALSIYGVSGTEAEIGRIMIGDLNARGKGYGYRSLISAMKIGFDCLGLRSFHLSVHEKNISALKTYKRAGFETVGTHPFNEEGIELEMTIEKEKYENDNPQSNEIKLYRG